MATDVGAVVEIRGVLMHHADNPFFDSYDDIRARVAMALGEGARTIVLAIDSPGGLLSGMLDAAVGIRRACDATGARLVAYVDGQACSAAYALACVADELVVSSTAIVGSIGVLDTLLDVTAADAASGLRYSVVASGDRKTDGNPHTETTSDELAATQARVDELAAIFFDHVAAYRPITSEQVRALQAAALAANRAVEVGLADRVASLDDLLESLKGKAA